MSITFENINFKRIVLHNVFRPDANGQVEPRCGTALIVLEPKAQGKLEERLSSALGKGASSLEMEIAQDGVTSCFHSATKLLDLEDADFISSSEALADLHTTAHTSKGWPDGTLVIIHGTVGAANRRCVFIVKAEKQSGFRSAEVDDNIIMELLEDLILTPSSKLYKVGVFVETDQSSLGQDIRNPNDFRAYVFDKNIQARDDRRAAQYFYSGFLGLKIPQNAEQRTRDFHEYTTNFIKEANLTTEERVDLQQALYTYLKVDQGQTIQTSSFAEKYIKPELQDDFTAYMEKKNFPTNAVQKDLTLIKNKLKNRKMNYDTGVKLIAPADRFKELINVLETTSEYTNIRIMGQLASQE